jgi:hypothetical protein
MVAGLLCLTLVLSLHLSLTSDNDIKLLIQVSGKQGQNQTALLYFWLGEENEANGVDSRVGRQMITLDVLELGGSSLN